MHRRILDRVNTAIEGYLPERRLFLKSDTETRFVRLRPLTQALLLSGGAMLIGWTIIVSAIFFMDSIGSGGAREQAQREREIFESRLAMLTADRDRRLDEAKAAEERFAVALRQVSAIQSELMASEERRRELETGIEVIQKTLKRAMVERDAARDELEAMTVAAVGGAAPQRSEAAEKADLSMTVDFLTAALDATAGERDAMAGAADAARAETEDLIYEQRLAEERNDEIFSQLEEAVTISMAPLDKMFTSAGLDPDDLIATVRRGYSGQGGTLGPLMPGVPAEGRSDPNAQRAARILEGLDRMNMYRIAAEKAPFAIPVKTAFRFTSGFGRRWGRLHAGVDLAGSYGAPIYATADGVVVKAGPMSGYGQLVEIRHDFGLSTRYGHLSRIEVRVGQRVSRGDRIGAMGSSGNSTGTHLHYEVRVDGEPKNPMTYIKAASNVF
ncbi:MAG: DUF5930 domain-containing protein [Rhodobacteraceae bacterium]|nr:DUF5930 domain-containing protein [Paracoccaceae bacterium]